ncbi:putative SIT4 phosphatase-associated protein family [Helianthus annuus]|uniref:SIT4 phosphatase-associated protein family n=1 Tax=Helianthus annuus TaxID=4232 RepID=A0A251SLD6_HELAN|nr:serine/threonine-protein phosphatase 6 regulatory subunit 3 isoform X2 [Helianthus annuus]KAF5770187.1 putative SIT4 phosphatase-associated protein family [Helianthus annuus]KAJ0465133.1 putative SIT4 phosphatase-associated protein family [Helianthus annuus]KAJ0469862.1 putative SIT4 phosphatase-associated protein family [Helianthus annuus]KAJ0486724.1 putative SIT4 phosphatase-associated protein family [Helianthus annuus]KAJ0660856.1 putative SIT4 phosphatase-associated protein family [Hel
MFWKLTASSPIESVLDKENLTLEELLDEEDIIQECKTLNSRLINFLRDRAQVEQLLRYIIEESQECVDSKRTFKFPFVACEIFTCEIDVIFKTLVEEDELMNLLFSFLEPTRPHSPLLAGFFSKVVICLMLRKTVPLINYVQVHRHILQQLVDLIGITSIKEVLVRLVGAEDHMYPNYAEVMQLLAESNFLEMIVDKLNPSNPPEVHANAAETLCAITRSAPSPLAAKLSSSSYVTRIFTHAFEDSLSKSGLFHSLTVCISLLDPKRSAPSSLFNSFRGQYEYESHVQVNHETVGAMLPQLGDLLTLLNVSLDEKILPCSYGLLKPPLGKHRLKIVEFIAVLLKTGNQTAVTELIASGTIQRVLDLFFEYPFNNALHHHVESIIYSCLESKNDTIIDHLFQDCGLTAKILQTENRSTVSSELNQPTISASGRNAPRVGNIGHVTRIANKITQLGNGDTRIQTHIKENSEWNEWHTTVLQERNIIENVYRWACGRPSALHDRSRDSDEDDRDYDVAALANNLGQAFRYNLYDNDESQEGHDTVNRDDEDIYFDDESAEVFMSSLKLGDDHGSMFTNSNWFAFQDESMGDDVAMSATSPSEQMDEIDLNSTSNGGNNSREEEDEELADDKNSNNGTSISNSNPFIESNIVNDINFKTPDSEKSSAPVDESMLEWVAGAEPGSVSGSGVNPFLDYLNTSSVDSNAPADPSSDSIQRAVVAASSVEDVEFEGAEIGCSEKAMNQALKEGTVGEAGPLKKQAISNELEKGNPDQSGSELSEFNDTNYWRVDQQQ